MAGSISTELDADVIIIGAGISGLKAASDLNSKNVKTLILEARDRIGGRILTDRSNENHYDLGASWFHSTMENPLFDKFTKEWYSSKDSTFDDFNIGVLVDTESGSLPSDCQSVNSIVDEIKYHASKNDTDESLQNALINYLNDKSYLLNENEIKYSAAIYKFAELMSGCKWDMISSKFAYGPFNGRDSFNRIGYDTVLDKIIESYNKDDIKLNSVVKSIEKIQVGKADNTIIKVTTKDAKSFTSKYVIVTVPLGVLKLSAGDLTAEGAITFKPQLPKPILDNFDKTHFSTLAKVIVEFEKPFWPDNDKFLVLSTPKDDELKTKLKISEFDNYENAQPVKAFEFPCLISNFQKVRNVPALMFLVPSQAAKQIEGAENPREYGYQLIKPLLQKLCKNGEVPEPKLVLTTNWGSDPYSRGAISACAPGDVLVNDSLIDGFGNIRFAGEDTTYQGHCCAHGAYLSGEREASWILDRINQ